MEINFNVNAHTSDLKLDKTGFLAAIPYLAMAMVVQCGGQLADWVRSRWRVETKVRKIFTCGAFVAQTIFMLATAYTHAVTLAIICLTVGVGFGGFAWSGFSVNYLDIAPQFASLIMGLSNTVATVPGIISPMITGYIVQKQDFQRVAYFVLHLSRYLHDWLRILRLCCIGKSSNLGATYRRKQSKDRKHCGTGHGQLDPQSLREENYAIAWTSDSNFTKINVVDHFFCVLRPRSNC
ncbi:putative Vesicular glutamate transporter 2 [Daphnia magna]|uniref:Putative Vesicular glutamate transporter 2 n=1 Tax=Daphnia magna TaxID=35525 RepID=A0A164LEX9_9CRUS|nr:putative Vesicular glutamate transporter 2 [Daphnia magna]